MKKYEGLFILNLAGKEEGVTEVVSRVEAELTAAGGKVEAVQKLDKKQFARVTDRKVVGGHYVNFVFQATPEIAAALGGKFRLSPDIYRCFISEAGEFVPQKP